MKYLSVLALGFLLAASQAAMADDDDQKDPTGVATLLCKMSQHAQVMTQTLAIDYDKKLVNGISAYFTPSTISWDLANGSKTQHFELNRVTGDYYSWIEGDTTPMPAFTCTVAPKKF